MLSRSFFSAALCNMHHVHVSVGAPGFWRLWFVRSNLFLFGVSRFAVPVALAVAHAYLIARKRQKTTQDKQRDKLKGTEMEKIYVHTYTCVHRRWQCCMHARFPSTEDNTPRLSLYSLLCCLTYFTCFKNGRHAVLTRGFHDRKAKPERERAELRGVSPRGESPKGTTDTYPVDIGVSFVVISCRPFSVSKEIE